MNISAIWKLKGAWEKFTANHPKFPLFLDAIQRKGVTEGTGSLSLTLKERP